MRHSFVSVTSSSTCVPALVPGVDWLGHARRAGLRKWVSDEQQEAGQGTLPRQGWAVLSLFNFQFCLLISERESLTPYVFDLQKWEHFPKFYVKCLLVTYGFRVKPSTI